MLAYAVALWCLAPDIARRAVGLARGVLSRVPLRRRTRPATATTQ
jgi:hypothetical protein